MTQRPEIITPPVTAFTAHGDVDLGATRQLLAFAEPHVDGVFAVGTTGEFPALTREERHDLVAVCSEVFGPERTIAHVGAPSFHQALPLLRDALELGVRRFAAITPYYLTASDEGILNYFSALRQATDGELYAYIFPDVACSDVSPELLARLAGIGIDGVKTSGRASARVADYRRTAPSLSLWSGNDAQLPEVLAQGGRGVVSGVSGVAPEAFARLRNALAAGDQDGARQAQKHVVSLVKALGPSITRLREGLAQRGLDSGTPRMPIDVPGAECRREISLALEPLLTAG